MKGVFRLDKNAYRRLQDRAYRSQQRDHSEVCGAILRTESSGIELSYLTNQGKRSGSFEIDKNDLKALRKGSLAEGNESPAYFILTLLEKQSQVAVISWELQFIVSCCSMTYVVVKFGCIARWEDSIISLCGNC
jgi:hypothetical protein